MRKDKLIMLCMSTILSLGSLNVGASDEVVRSIPRRMVGKIGNASIYESEDESVVVETPFIKTKGTHINLRIVITDLRDRSSLECFYLLVVGTDYHLMSQQLNEFIDGRVARGRMADGSWRDIFELDVIPFVMCESLTNSPTERE